MKIRTKLLRSQLALVNKIANVCSIETSRLTQDTVGELMAQRHKSDVCYTEEALPDCSMVRILPATCNRKGAILYFHGGGYVSGGMEYAKGFGTILAAKYQLPVVCVAYRLAPEHPFPAALDDAVAAYQRLSADSDVAGNIVLCGESAGGGLIFALALRLKAEGLPLPVGILAISPWTDLTASGDSYHTNEKQDPSMTKERLRFYAECYTKDWTHPFVSPLFGELTGLPPSLIFVGGDEIMRSDAVNMAQKLTDAGCHCTLHVAPEMWHIYLLYGIPEADADFERIEAFLDEVLYERA